MYTENIYENVYKDVEHTYTGTSPIKEGAYTNIVNMIDEYNKALGLTVTTKKVGDKFKGTYRTVQEGNGIKAY